MTLPITNFDFATYPADTEALIATWIPEVEAEAEVYLRDHRFITFFVAGLRLGANTKGLQGLKLERLTKTAGYSRSTFFRLFESQTGFLLKGYQLTCLLSTRVYAKHLKERELTLDEFCTFTADVFFGANCAIPAEFIQVLWRKHNKSHIEFHPHIMDIATIVEEYLRENHKTAHLAIDREELKGVLKALDLSILNARLDNDPRWGTPYYYHKLRKILLGYLLLCE